MDSRRRNCAHCPRGRSKKRWIGWRRKTPPIGWRTGTCSKKSSWMWSACAPGKCDPTSAKEG
eukprot:scaffold776_cov347-Pavlova_lutheri.AAC.11